MKLQSVRSILKALPNDFTRHAVRDISLPTSAIFAEVHFTTLPTLTGITFSAIAMQVEGKQVSIFRSPAEYVLFSQRVAKSIILKPALAQAFSKKLISHTNWLNKFVRTHRTLQLFKKDAKKFFEMYRWFFAYHQVVGFGGEYLAEHVLPKKKTTAIKSAVRVLGAAYAYNEMLVPTLEKYFIRLRLTQTLPDEIKVGKKSSLSNRSVLYIGGERIVFGQATARRFADAVDRRQGIVHTGVSQVRGIAAVKGVYVGLARVITDLSKLSSIKSGEVLITPITRPQYNSHIRKAGAIVTDLGGLLSHPVIIAREARLPCVVGTTIATKVFKTGDRIEVSGFTGVVKKIP